MKFIEISEGFSVNLEDIIAVEQVEQDPEGMLSTVYLRGLGPRGSTFPYLALLQILDSNDDDEEELTVLKSMDNTLRHNAQRFGG